jgi:CheY-like chemotaxis protein
LDEIRKAASKGAELTHRLLAFGRRQILRPEVLNLNLLIMDAQQMLQPLIGDHITLATKLEPELRAVCIDGGSFHQVLMNLAVNARDAMPHGGILTIATTNATVSAFDAALPLPPGEYVEVSVSDAGIGMTEEVRSHLFEPFFTTKEQGKGTGLGLSMVYGIIQQSGGSILVDSTLGKGSIFRIYFPCVRTEQQPPQPAETVPEVQRGSETILLAEDREDVRSLTARILRGLGYSVLEADGAERAMEFVQNRDRAIDMLLTDIAMPGLSGFELADRIRTFRSAIKVLFMSGSPDPSHFSEKLASVTDSSYLQKPFAIQTLASAVRDLLDRV